MPHDLNNVLLNVGDKVVLEAEITSISSNEDFCNLSVRAVNPAKPFSDPHAMRNYVFNAAQVKKV